MGTDLKTSKDTLKCANKGCTLRDISDQTFSPVEAEFFLVRPKMYPLCYGCTQMLQKILKGNRP